MGGSIPQIAVYVLGASLFGGIVGWLIRAAISNRRIAQLTGESQTKLDEVTSQRDQFATEYSKSRSMIGSLQAAVAKHCTELESALEKSKLLARNVHTLRAEREDTKIKVSAILSALNSVKKQTAALQTEFVKTSDFYKGELIKSFEKRKALKIDVKNARSEQKAFGKLLKSSVSEYGSADKMIVDAQQRLGQLGVLERNVNKLETENAQLNDDVIRMKHEIRTLERTIAGLDELKIHNQQLVRCAESLESSRSQHEHDADRYRDQAEQSEQLSDTLRFKLDDLEKNFAEIEKQQNKALRIARTPAVVPISNANK